MGEGKIARGRREGNKRIPVFPIISGGSQLTFLKGKKVETHRKKKNGKEQRT